jgi:hypothetical protein
MKKILSLISICAFGFISLNAQIKPALTGGIDFTSMNLKLSNPNDLCVYGTLGYHFGLDLKVPIKENINFSTGLTFSKKGFKQTFHDPYRSSTLDYDSITNISANYYYLEVPLLIEFKAKLDKINMNFAVGPYVAFGIGGNANVDINSYYSDYTYSEKVLWKSYYAEPTEIGPQLIYDYRYTQIKRLDYGMMVRFGAEFKAFTLSAEYKYGLANIMSAYSKGEKMKNHSLGLSLTYRFNPQK